MEATTTVNALFSEGVNTLTGLSISTDAAIIGTLFAVLLALAWWVGVARMSAILLSLCLAVPLYLNFTYVNKLLSLSLAGTAQGTFFSYLLIFAVFALFCYLVLRRYASAGSTYGQLAGAVEYIMLALTGVGLLLAIGYRILPLVLLYDFNPGIDRFFAEPNFFFWWLLAPLLAIFVSTRR